MVQTKKRAKRTLSCFLGPDSEDSAEPQSQVDMAKKSRRPRVLSKLEVKQIPDRQVPCTLDGRWIDGKYHLITKA